MNKEIEDLNRLIKQAKNVSPYENLSEILGDLGDTIYEILNHPYFEQMKNDSNEWVEFKSGVALPSGLLLYKFDNGDILLNNSKKFPFAVMTHFKQV